MLLRLPAQRGNRGRLHPAMSGTMLLGGNRLVTLRVVAAGGVVTVLASKASSCVPFLILSVAGITRSRLVAVRMKSGSLVEGDELARVRRAEDMATMAAVVFPDEKVEIGLALRGITTG